MRYFLASRAAELVSISRSVSPQTRRAQIGAYESQGSPKRCSGTVDNLFGEIAMMGTANHLKFFRCLFGSACIAALVVSCTSDVSEPPPTDGSYPEPKPEPNSPPDDEAMDLDPTGNWDLTYMLLPGCGLPASTATDTFTVTRAPNGYAVSAGIAATTGTLLCAPENCKLSAVLVWSDSSYKYQQSFNMSLNTHNAITGNGTVSFADQMTTCSIAFTVTGLKD
jgi:hypothetical protein